jgi:alcohol dehydrogenase, propanol-preferring
LAQAGQGVPKKSPQDIDCAIIYAPVGGLVPLALGAVRKDGRVVCAGIHMSNIPAFPYRLLWEERELRSAANLTRRDGDEFLDVAAKASVVTETVRYPLTHANEALSDLRMGRLQGAAVLVPDESQISISQRG